MNERALREALRQVIDQFQSLGGNIPQNVVDQMQILIERATQRLQEFRQPTERFRETPLPLGTELLWQLAGGNEDAFANYLRTVPDANLNNLLRNPGQLTSVIRQLNRQMPPESLQQGEAGGIPQAPLDSSNIYGFDYDPRSRKLAVRFQGGSIYTYDGVPPGIFMVFQQGAVPAKTEGANQYGQWWRGKQPSLGAAFYEMIRNGGYPYQKVA